MRRSVAYLAGALLFLHCSVSAADAGQINRYLSGLKTLKADFSQVVETDDGRSRAVNGVLYLSRPGKFRWDYSGELAQLIVADGSTVWLLDRELEQVSHQPQSSALRGTPAQLLSGSEGVESHFTVKGETVTDGLRWTALQPKDDESQVETVRVGFSGQELAVLEMHDKFGQTTSFRFSGVQRNPDLDADLFAFKAPAGFDVWEH